MEAHETRPRRDCFKIFHPRRDRDETSSKILYETEMRPRVSVPSVSRPRRDRDSRPSLFRKKFMKSNSTHFLSSANKVSTGPTCQSVSVKDESLGLETEGTETLGLVQNFCTGLISVLSQIKFFESVLSRSRLVCFHFTQSRLGLILTRMCSFQRN